MNKNPVVESEKTIHNLRKEIKELKSENEKTEVAINPITPKIAKQEQEIEKLRSLLKGLLFQYHASNLPEWDEVREAREYLGTFDKINSQADSNNKQS